MAIPNRILHSHGGPCWSISLTQFWKAPNPQRDHFLLKQIPEGGWLAFLSLSLPKGNKNSIKSSPFSISRVRALPLTYFRDSSGEGKGTVVSLSISWKLHPPTKTCFISKCCHHIVSALIPPEIRLLSLLYSLLGKLASRRWAQSISHHSLNPPGSHYCIVNRTKMRTELAGPKTLAGGDQGSRCPGSASSPSLLIFLWINRVRTCSDAQTPHARYSLYPRMGFLSCFR